MMRKASFAVLSSLALLGCGQAGEEPQEHTGKQDQSAVLATGFAAESMIGNLDMPTAMRFAPDGRIFVSEKSGLIKVYSGFGAAPVTVADLRTDVMDYWDRGLLDIAVNPAFPAKPYLYALYTLDGRLGDSVAAGTVPRYRDACNDPQMSCTVASHLDRIVLDPATGVMVSRTTLVENWGDEFPSHGIGSMQWGPDGSLYISGGDGASFAAVDYGGTGNPLGDPPNAGASLTPPTAKGGALRSQIITPPPATPAFPTWFNGKVLRINPETMTPLLDPRALPTTPSIIANGLRNPFRMTFRAPTNELWIGDVGWNDWEEINRIADVAAAAPTNFGWPCYEGPGRQGGYESAGLSVCQSLYGAPGSVTAPRFAYSHATNVAAGDGCGTGGASVTGLAFYDGAAFPAQYQGALFFSDYARQCTWFLPAGADGLPTATPQVFARGAGAPVQLTVGPDGDLYYVDIQGGQIGRFHYVAANHPPQAVITTSGTSGFPPFSVTFDASGSTDSDTGDTLTYAWDLDGDGAFDDGTGAVATFTYATQAMVTVKVRVTDSQGASSIASTVVSAGNAPVPVITLVSGANWAVGDAIVANGSATDAEDGTLGPTALDWQIIVQHCPFGQACHQHVLEDLSNLSQVSVLGPDHDYPAHIDIVLTATDSNGLSATTTLSLEPATTAASVNSIPAGLKLALNQTAAAAPVSATVIRNATVSVSAPPQVSNGVLYGFSSWSDGGAATHALHPMQPTLNLTATFTAVATEQNLTASATPIAFMVAPTGGGNKNLAIIKDGVKPAVGSTDYSLQYDTYAGGEPRPSDWVGYTIPAPMQFTRLVFEEGGNFADGGAFDTLRVQTRNAGVWSDVTNLVVTPAYPGLNGLSFETFQLSFDPQTGDAIRLFGTPAGAAQFISVAELEVYGVPLSGVPGNLPPSANAGPDQTVNVNTAVALSGSGVDPEGTALSYAWTQLSGAAVSLTGANTAAPSFVAPAAAGPLTFQLMTNDGVQNSPADTVVVTVNDPNAGTNVNLTANGTPIAFVVAPTGGGNKNLALIKDGVKPAVGSNDSTQQYDSYNGGGARASDWFGYTFTSAKLFNKVVFQEGMNFDDGGAFTNLGVQVRVGGVWTDVTGVVSTPAYTGLNAVNYETFTLTFAGVSGDGIRIFGAPAGSAKFTSIAELEVYGSDQAGPPPNLAPSANAGPDQSVTLGAAVTLSGSGSDPEGAAITYLWSQIGGPAVTLSSTTGASPTFTAPAAATTLTFQLVTSDGTQSSAADSVVVNVAAAVNQKPTANAGADKSVVFAAAVTLNGTGADPEGAAITYLWSQIGGPVVTLAGTTTANLSFTAPSVVTTLTFQLVTNDGTQDSVADSVVVTVNDPNPPANVNITASGTPVALIVAPTGGGNKNLAVIKDGVKPALGSTNGAQQYDTYNGGGARASDWVGYTFTSAKQFNRLVFQEGMNFFDGGAFATAPTVQVRNAGVWSAVTGLAVTPAYPGLNNVNYETWTLTFTQVTGDGIRLFGTPAGSAHFMSIAELEVYGSDTAGPPQNLAPSANAGPDQGVLTNAAVTLAGSGSDPEGSAISYQWSQVGGPVVALSSTTAAAPTFTAPAAATTLTFQLVTNDGTQNSTADVVVITVAAPVNLKPTANAGADQSVLTNAAVTLVGSGADPEGAAITYAWSQIGGPVVTLSSATAASPTFTAPAAATSLTFQLVTNDGTQGSVADSVIVTVSAPTNLRPTANAGPDQSVLTGATVTLAGSGVDPEGVSIGYTWSQTSGTAVTLSSTAVASPTFTAPSAATTLTFQLLTNDGTQTSLADSVVITVDTGAANTNLTAAGTPVALITAPTGLGSKTLAVIKDGVKPAVGSNNSAQQYDTYNGGGARPNDWVGYTFTSSKLFNKVVFQEGQNFGDGGAYTAASLTVQVRVAGSWVNVGGLVVTPTYPGLNTTNFETYTLTFNGTTGDGVRIYGTPAGASHFISVAELEVYGSNTGGPPPNLPPTADAGADRTANIGSAVALQGSGTDPEGAALTYQWTQIGGSLVTLTGAQTATPSFTAPALPTTLTFQLVTNDGVQNGSADTVDVVVTDPATVNLAPSGTPVAFITAPTGGGNKNLAIIKDGVKPAPGTNNNSLQYDTYNGGGARASDWVGYTFTSAKQFTRVVFVEGGSFGDGGAFNVGTLTVQVRSGGVWTNVSGLAFTPTYAGLNGISYDSYQMTFAAATGDGIRIFGTPAGSAHFISIAELEVYGN